MRNDILLYAALLVTGFLLVWGIIGMAQMSGGHTQERYEKALSSELQDKCATPPGYTDEQWKQHMSHHPDRYRECLE
jgi:hypothetical protein